MWRSRHRVVLAIGAMAAALIPWVAVSLLAHGIFPRWTELAERAFGWSILATYMGLWMLALAMARSPRIMLVRVILTTLTGLAILGLLELPAALKLVHWDVVFRNLSGEGFDYRSAFVLDADLGFRRIPGKRWSGRPQSDIEASFGLPATIAHPIRFTYDRWGYRNATEMPEADVVLLGDSFVEGWYVSDEQTVAVKLAERLGRSVANLGVAGYGTVQELRVLKSDALQRRPRVVGWFFFEGNDLYNDMGFEYAQLGGPPSQESATVQAHGLAHFHTLRERSFVFNVLGRLRRISDPWIPAHVKLWATYQDADGQPLRIYFGPEASVPWSENEERQWGKTRAAFESGIAIAGDAGVEVILVYVPNKFRVYRDFVGAPKDPVIDSWQVWTALPQAFQSLCDAQSVPCVDLTPALTESLRQGTMVYSPNDTHWSPEGHAVAAAVLEEPVRALLERGRARQRALPN